MIPKIIHYCWFGNNEKSELIVRCIDSWKKYMPDYEIIEWNEKNIGYVSNAFFKKAYEEKNWAFCSDYVRIKSLKKYGGIYLDTDVEVLKSFTPLLDTNFFIGFEDDDLLGTSVIGSIKDGKFISDFYNIYESKKYDKQKMIPNVVDITLLGEKYLLMRNGTNQILRENIAIYNKNYFSPKNIITNILTITDETYSIHHFDGSWTKKNNFKRKSKKILYSFLGEEKFMKIVKYIRKKKR